MSLYPCAHISRGSHLKHANIQPPETVYFKGNPLIKLLICHTFVDQGIHVCRVAFLFLKQGCPQAAIYFFKIILELQSIECNVCYLFTKTSVLRYLLSENRYLLWNFGTPLLKKKMLVRVFRVQNGSFSNFWRAWPGKKTCSARLLLVSWNFPFSTSRKGHPRSLIDQKIETSPFKYNTFLTLKQKFDGLLKWYMLEFKIH